MAAKRRGTRINFFYSEVAGEAPGHTKFMYFRGTAPLTKVLPSGGGTSLSAGTIQVTTGLTTVYDFQMSLTGGASLVSVAAKRNMPRIVGWRRGYKNAGGVTIVIAGVSQGAVSALTPAMALSATFSGCTIFWQAIGL